MTTYKFVQTYEERYTNMIP